MKKRMWLKAGMICLMWSVNSAFAGGKDQLALLPYECSLKDSDIPVSQCKVTTEEIDDLIENNGWGIFSRDILREMLEDAAGLQLLDKLHREHTGSSNFRILDNLKRLSKCGVPIEFRIPTIPGFNADEESFAATGKLLSGLSNIVGLRLLPYHLARSKYETVGHTDTMPHVDPPPQAQMDTAASCLKKCNNLPLIPQ